MAKQCGREPLVSSVAAPAVVRLLAEALCLVGAASTSSSPWFPTAMCKGVGGKVLTASFISDPNAQGQRRGRAPRGSAQTLSQKKGGERDEKVFACWTGPLKDDNKNNLFWFYGSKRVNGFLVPCESLGFSRPS